MTTFPISAENKLIRGWLTDRVGPVGADAFIVTDARDPEDVATLLVASCRAQAAHIASGDACEGWDGPAERDEAVQLLARFRQAAARVDPNGHHLLTTTEFLSAAAARYANV